MEDDPQFVEFFLKNRFRQAADYYQKAMPNWEAIRTATQLTPYQLFATYAWARFKLLMGEAREPEALLEGILSPHNSELANYFPDHYAHLQDQLANIKFYFGEYRAADELIKRAITLKRNPSTYRSKMVKARALCRGYTIAGKASWKQGNLFQALLYYLKAIEEWKVSKFERSHFTMGRILTLIGQVYLDLGEPTFAAYLFQNSLNGFNDHDEMVSDHLYVGVSRSLLAKAMVLAADKEKRWINHDGIDRQARSQEAIIEATRILRKAVPQSSNHRYAAGLESTRALRKQVELHLSSNDRSVAVPACLDAFDREIKVRDKAFNSHHPTIAIACNRMVKILLDYHRDIDPAAPVLSGLSPLDKAIQLTFKAEKAAKNTQPIQYSIFERPEDRAAEVPPLFRAMVLRAEVYFEQYRLSGRQDLHVLDQARKTILQALQVGDLICRKINKVVVEYSFGRSLRTAHEQALKILLEVHRQPSHGTGAEREQLLGQVFQVMEGARAVNHFDRLQHQLRHYQGDDIGSLLLLGFHNFKEQIREVVRQVSDRENPNLSQPISMLNDKLEAMGRLIDAAQESYDYEKSKKYLEKLTPELLWKYYRGGEPGAIISYLLCEDAIFYSLIDNQGKRLIFDNLLDGKPDPRQEVVDLKDTLRWIGNEMNCFHQADTPSTAPPSMRFPDNFGPGDQGYRFYNNLIALHDTLVAPIPLREFKRLYIIPDGELFTLPFEMLSPRMPTDWFDAQGEGAFSRLEYLNERFQISYHPSISTLFRQHYEDESFELRHPGQARRRVDFEAASLIIGGNIYKPPERERPTLYGHAEAGASPEEKQEEKPNGFEVHETDECALLPVLRLEENEVRFVGRLHSEDALITKEAVLDFFREIGGRPIVLYLFVHTQPQGKDEERLAMIVQTQHGQEQWTTLLTQEEIADICRRNRLNIRLLLFVACRAGDGGTVHPESPIPLSLTNAFLRNGASNIVYPLFRISGLYGALLVDRFLANLLKNQWSFSPALQEARRFMYREQGLGHPFYWASIIFTGNQLLGLYEAMDPPLPGPGSDKPDSRNW